MPFEQRRRPALGRLLPAPRELQNLRVIRVKMRETDPHPEIRRRADHRDRDFELRSIREAAGAGPLEPPFQFGWGHRGWDQENGRARLVLLHHAIQRLSNIVGHGPELRGQPRSFQRVLSPLQGLDGVLDDQPGAGDLTNDVPAPRKEEGAGAVIAHRGQDPFSGLGDRINLQGNRRNIRGGAPPMRGRRDGIFKSGDLPRQLQWSPCPSGVGPSELLDRLPGSPGEHGPVIRPLRQGDPIQEPQLPKGLAVRQLLFIPKFLIGPRLPGVQIQAGWQDFRRHGLGAGGHPLLQRPQPLPERLFEPRAGGLQGLLEPPRGGRGTGGGTQAGLRGRQLVNELPLRRGLLQPRGTEDRGP